MDSIRYCAYNNERVCDEGCVALGYDKYEDVNPDRTIKDTECGRGNFIINRQEEEHNNES